MTVLTRPVHAAAASRTSARSTSSSRSPRPFTQQVRRPGHRGDDVRAGPLQRQLHVRAQGADELSLAAAALSAAQLIWNYPQLSAQHRAAAVRYATVRRQLDIMLADRDRLTDDNVNAVSATWEDIEKAAPALSRPVRRRARREIADRIARRPTTQITPAGRPRTGA
ncbi:MULTISPECIES: hypothetical protein [Streptomyces violaceusniger group]|uniref:hypothetical protein n=1 Tax=Streptomyces violaceusniger group TaxID=2839105 RepID=UPI00142D3DA8